MSTRGRDLARQADAVAPVRDTAPARHPDSPPLSTPAPQPLAARAGHASGGRGALRADLALIADWIAPGARVLDLGCGDGALLAHLQAVKGCSGYGVEIDDAAVLACAQRGVNVIQQDIEAGLDMFASVQFDVVVLSMAIQATYRTERVIREMSAVGREGIVSFPNFGHWSHAWSLMRGRMPVSREMPYEWYDTPNLHLTTLADFEAFLDKLDLTPTARACLVDGRPVRLWPSGRATQAVYRFRRKA